MGIYRTGHRVAVTLCACETQPRIFQVPFGRDEGMPWQERKLPLARLAVITSARLASGRSDISSHVPATVMVPRHTYFNLLTL